MPRLINLQSGNRSIRNTVIIVDERNWPHDTPHAQSSNQLITSSSGAINGNTGQTILTAGKRYVLSSRKPVPQKILPHCQTQAAQHDEAQPPIIENNGPGNHILMVAIPVNDNTKH